MTELLKLGQKLFVDGKCVRRKEPIFFGKEAFFWESSTDRSEPVVLGLHLRHEGNVQRPTRLRKCYGVAVPGKAFDTNAPTVTFLPLFSSARASPVLRPILLHLCPAGRARLCQPRLVYNQAQLKRALLRWLVLARVWARAPRSPPPMPQLRRPCPSIRERFSLPSFSRVR